jgi:hypothetical protein
MWTLGFGDHEDRTPTRGYTATREAAMAVFAKSARPSCRLSLSFHHMASTSSFGSVTR